LSAQQTQSVTARDGSGAHRWSSLMRIAREPSVPGS